MKIIMRLVDKQCDANLSISNTHVSIFVLGGHVWTDDVEPKHFR